MNINRIKKHIQYEYLSEKEWMDLIWNKKVSLKIIDEFSSKLTYSMWAKISCSYKLNEDFIKKYADKLDWYHVSSSQKLSEDLIIQYQNKVNWHFISYFQKFSPEFIKKYFHKLDFCNLIYKNNFTKKLLAELKPQFKEKMVAEFKNSTIIKDFVQSTNDKLTKTDWTISKRFLRIQKYLTDLGIISKNEC